jgi:MFS family permease
MGMLADRVSRVRLLLIAVLAWCGGLALSGLSHALWLLVCSKGITGVGAAIAYPAAMSLFSDYFPPDRRSLATASYGVGQTLGGAGATLIGGLGYQALTRMVRADPDALLGLAPWRAVWLLFACVGILLVPALLTLREPARQEIGRGAAGGKVRELWAYRHFLAPTFVGITLLSGVVTGLQAWIPPSLMRLFDQQPGDFAGWASAAALVAGTLSTLAGARLLDLARRRDGRAAVMRPAMWAALALAPTCGLAIMPNVPCFAIGYFLFTFFSGVAISIPVVSINFRIPNELRGFTMGLYVLLIALTSSLTAPLIASVSVLMGGNMMIGRAMAVVGVPFALLTALAFWAASRVHVGVEGAPLCAGNEAGSDAGT